MKTNRKNIKEMTRKERKGYLINFINVEFTQDLWELIEYEKIDKDNFWKEKSLLKIRLLKNMMKMDGSWHCSSDLMMRILHRF